MKKSQMKMVEPLLKKAFDHRYRLNVCKALIKSAQEQAEEEKKIDYVARRRKLKMLLYSLAGGLIGASKSRPKNRLEGLLAGAGIGAGTAYASNKIREWAGLDPWGKSVTLAKQAPGT